MCVAVGGLVGWQVNAIVADAEVTHSRPRPIRCLKNESDKGAHSCFIKLQLQGTT